MPPANTVESLYHAHHNWLTGWLRRKLGCPHNAADLAQDTFIRVLTAREAAPIIEPRAFLTTVAKRVLFNYYRRQDLERAYLDALAQMPEQVVPSEEEKAIILQTLVELDQGLQDDRFFFFAGNHLFRHLRQGVEVSALKVLAAVVVEQHALGDGGEECPRLDDGRRFASGQDPDKGVLRQVGGVVRAAKLASQPTGEPVVMGVVETFNGIGWRQRDHSGSLRML